MPVGGEEVVNRSSGDTFPRPDPTKLTTEQLTREIASLEKLLSARMDGQDKTIEVINKAILARPAETEKMVDHLKGFLETRMDGSDKATGLLQTILDRVPSQVDEKLNALRSLHEEKFASVDKQFAERDVRSSTASQAAKEMVSVALMAAKEAVAEQNKSSALAIAKSEAATIKQIDQQGQLLTTTAKGFDDKIADIKERMDRMEGQGSGRSSQTVLYFAILSAVISVIGVVVVIAVAIKNWTH